MVKTILWVALIAAGVGDDNFGIAVVDRNMSYTYEFPRPSIAASMILYDIVQKKVLIVKRKKDPHKGAWVFPGGFLNPLVVGDEEKHPGENIHQTAKRETFEETGLDIPEENFQVLDIRSNPDRDIRDGQVIDIGFFAAVKDAVAKANDDVEDERWVDMEKILSEEIELGFDHIEMAKRSTSIIATHNVAESLADTKSSI